MADPCGLKAGQGPFGHGLRFACCLGSGGGGMQRTPGFGCLHLAKAGRVGITGRHARGGLGSPAVDAVASLRGRLLPCQRRAAAALVRCQAPVHFLLPNRCRIGLAH